MKENKTNISRYPIPEFDSLPEDIQEIFKGAQERFGFVPNVLTTLSHRPAELRAFMTYNAAVMDKESGLTAADKEMLILAFSNFNGCTYCVQSHGASLRIAANDPQIADRVSINYRESDLTPRQVAMIDFAMKITKNSAEINENDFTTLRSHGFSDEDIWDIAGVTSFYNLSNRMMTFAAVRPDDQFYMMGRK